jgi:2-polyprenyl-6-methoxyphenol hydroxylase-like FAD-dependent oxidoreductase
VLRARAEEHEARLRFGAELTALTHDEDGVTATIVDRASGRESSVRSLYVVAADGNASRVRTACGIGRTGSAEMGEFINALSPHGWGRSSRSARPGPTQS